MTTQDPCVESYELRSTALTSSSAAITFQRGPYPQHQRVADLSQDGGGLCAETSMPRPQGNNNRKPFHIGAT